MRLITPLVLSCLPALAHAAGHGEMLTCRAEGLSLSVERGAGFCIVDGRDAVLMSGGERTVCHISNPQLRILTIAPDLSFSYEDTDDDRMIRGTCAPA